MMDCFELHIDELNAQQKIAATSAIENRNNIFITGSAGTGKTFLLKYVIQELVRKYERELEGSGTSAVAVVAPTGISAINVGGQTIHSFAGIGLGAGDPNIIISKVLKNKASVERWQKCQVLIMDEVSMVDVGLFELLDALAREIKGI
jgi:ATP-dependent DNA helicase PIF1